MRARPAKKTALESWQEVIRQIPHKPNERPAKKRWTVAEYVPVVECNIATPDWVQITVNVMGGHSESMVAARRFAKLLNAAGIVLPARTRRGKP